MSKNQEKIDDWTDKLTNREPYSGQYQGKIDSLLEQVSNREQLRQVCAAVDRVLDPQERQVICMRYGLGNRNPRRQREVAKALNISRSYVSRIEKKALEKLRKALET